jgi:hypothetical protein
MTTIIERGLALNALRVANLRAFAAMLDAEAVAWTVLDIDDIRRGTNHVLDPKEPWQFDIIAATRRAQAEAVRQEANEIEAHYLFWRQKNRLGV